MPRPGAFAANFPPETLDAFRNLCKQQGRQYTKVLLRLAEIYLETNGGVLEASASVPKASGHSIPPVDHEPADQTKQELLELQNLEILQRLERVEADDREFVSAFEILIHRVESLEKKAGVNHTDTHHRPHGQFSAGTSESSPSLGTPASLKKPSESM